MRVERIGEEGEQRRTSGRIADRLGIEFIDDRIEPEFGRIAADEPAAGLLGLAIRLRFGRGAAGFIAGSGRRPSGGIRKWIQFGAECGIAAGAGIGTAAAGCHGSLRGRGSRSRIPR